MEQRIKALEAQVSSLQAYLRLRDSYTVPNTGEKTLTVVELAKKSRQVLATFELPASLPLGTGTLSDFVSEGVLTRGKNSDAFPGWMESAWTNTCGMYHEEQVLYLRRAGDTVTLDLLFEMPIELGIRERHITPMPDLGEYVSAEDFYWMHGATQACALAVCLKFAMFEACFSAVYVCMGRAKSSCAFSTLCST